MSPSNFPILDAEVADTVALWSRSGSADKLELAMRKKLQTGAAKDLNVWTVGTVNSNQTAPAPDFGYAAFPWW